LPCPYAERRGPLVYCRAAGRPVNPLAFPCLTNRYEACRYYREAEARAAGEEARAPQPPGRGRGPAGARRTRGLTRAGEPASNCRECVFYIKSISYCTLLGVEVSDPDDPPCAEA